MALTKVTLPLIDGASVSVLDFGADPSGTATANTTAIQSALDHIRDNGGTLVFPKGKTFQVNGQLTLQRSDSSHSTRWAIEGNNSAIHSSYDGDILKVGATAVSYFVERGSCLIKDLTIQGSETGNGSSIGLDPTYSQTGLYCYIAGNVVLENVQIWRCKTGIRTHFTFPLKSIASSVRGCWVGLHLDESSNLQDWDNIHTPSCRYGILIKSTTTSFDAGKTNNVTFTKWWPEGSQVGMVIDSGSGGSGAVPIRSISVIDPYVAIIEYDLIRLAKVYDFATPATRGADCSEYIMDVRFRDGLWNNTYSATSSAFVFDNNNRVAQCYIDVPIPSLDAESDSWVHSPAGGEIVTRGIPSEAEQGRTTKYIYNESGSLVQKVDHTGDIEFFGSTGIKFPTGSGISSSLLDDYEEGTFTPVIKGTTTAGTATYTTQTGVYTKIGNRVFFDVNLTWSGHTGTGFLRVGSLPYAPSAVFASCSIGNFNDISLTASTYAAGSVRDDVAEIEFREVLVGGGSAGVVSMDAAGAIRVSGVYSV